MEKHHKEVWARLCVGIVLNLVLLYMITHGLATWSSEKREIWLSFISSSLAIATWVLVIPVFWQGAPWQAPLAFVLVFFLPGLAILSAFSTIIRYW